MPGKVKYHELTNLQKKKYLGEFYSMVALLKNRDEVKSFFKDLLTLSEVVMISRRIQIAKLLLEGWCYDQIKEEMKVGLATISSVDRWLNNGFGGYKKVIAEFNKKNMKYGKATPKKRYGENTPFSFDWLKEKYPAHFLLLNIKK